MLTNQIRKWVTNHYLHDGEESRFFIVLGTVATSGRHLYLWNCRNLKSGSIFNEYEMEILTKSIEVKDDQE